MPTKDTTRLTDQQWIDGTVKKMMALDEGLGDEDLKEFVTDLAARPNWRALSPEDAATKALGELEPPERH